MKRIDARLQWIGGILLICFLVLFLQLNNLQVREANSLIASRYNPRTHQARQVLPRGAIVSADGVPLAYSTPSHDQWKYLRVYPKLSATMFSGIIGYQSIYYGVAGLEEEYGSYLVQHTRPVSIKDGWSKFLHELLTTQTVTDDVKITISEKLQAAAEEALGPYVGAVVAIDPRTGAILAMYANPTYDPNVLANHSIPTEQEYMMALKPDTLGTPLLDGAYQQRYAPGSTMKVVTSSAAFDHDPALVTTTSYPGVNCFNPGGDKPMCNFAHENCGGGYPDILRVSCDTAYGMMGLDLGADNLTAEAHAFGFEQAPPLDEPNLVASGFTPPGGFALNRPFLAYSAIGQGDVSASALQMALVAAGIANAGVIMKPHLMSSITDSLGNIVAQYTPEPWLHATSPATASAVESGMILVAQAGTAAGVFPSGLAVAAKTGTAQTGLNANSYGNDNWMIAFAPAVPGQTPTVAVAAVVPYELGENLGTNTTGAQIAGPVACRMLTAALGLNPASCPS